MKIKIIKIISFILIFCVLLYSVNKILRLKGIGWNHAYTFYQNPKNSIDVLFIGSSHVHTGIDISLLYKEYGISSYDFSSSGQPLPTSYFYVKEALKTQKPKLIIFDSYSLRHTDYRFHKDSYFMSGIFGMRFSLDRINLIKLQLPNNKWNGYFNPLLIYHNRYNNITKMDFLYYGMMGNASSKGYWYGLKNQKIQRSQISNFTELTNLNVEFEKYYRKIIELANNNNIPILIITIPFSVDKDMQRFFNTAKAIAEEYNVPFIDFNLYYDNYNLKFNEDFNDWSHLNYKGAAKFTRYLGKYLKENYDLPDRRGDHKYYSWEMNAKYQDKEIYNFELKKSANLNEYIEKVKNVNDYVIGITMLGNYKKNDRVVQSITTNFNINNIYLKNSSYVIDNNKLIYSSDGSNQYLFHKEIGSYTDLVVQNGQRLSINRKNYIKTKNGINMVIYDKFTEEIVDNIYLEYKGKTINPTIKR